MPEVAVRELTMAEAVREAMSEEMRRDPSVFIMGEDVAEAGTPFKVLSGMVEEFGTNARDRHSDFGAGFTGIGVGAAMTGLRPIVDIMFGDFLTLVMDQLVNQAAKVHYMSGGAWKVPMVLRTTLGASRRSAAQHSQSLQAWLSHVPGLKVVMPSTPYDAKGLLKTAIRDDNPVIFFEDKMMFRMKGPVPVEEYTIPFGVADIKREGRGHHAGGHQQHGASGAGRGKDARGNRDQRGSRGSANTWPLDEKTLIESAKKTSRAIVLDEGYETIWRDRGDRIGDRNRRVLRSGRAGETHWRDARADSIFSAARGCHDSDREGGFRCGAGDVQAVVDCFECVVAQALKLCGFCIGCIAQDVNTRSRVITKSHRQECLCYLSRGVHRGITDIRNDGGGLGTANRFRAPAA